jgi:hypothetical protein
MKTRIIVAAFLWLIAGAANGVMDTLFVHYSSSVFATEKVNAQYWDPYTSWENKYAKDAEGNLMQPLRQKFFGSTTFLVWLTDGWHLMKQIMLLAIGYIFVLLLSGLMRLHRVGWVNVALWLTVGVVVAYSFSIGFHVTYSWLLK